MTCPPTSVAASDANAPLAPPRAGFDRRTFLKFTALAVGAAAVPSLTGWGIASQASTSGSEQARLHIPPLIESTRDGDRRLFDLVAQAGRTAVIPGGEAETWGFNGSQLGPTVRVRRGEEVQINVRNDLDEATSVHWHGMHLPAEADGGPHQMIEPGAEWSPSWRVD